MDAASWDRFQRRLDEFHDWPCPYVFKFIVPKDQICAMFRLLAGHEYSIRDSSHGRYLCFTARIWMLSSAEVVALYRSARHIEGMIAL
jgi:uncharacterized protein